MYFTFFLNIKEKAKLHKTYQIRIQIVDINKEAFQTKEIIHAYCRWTL